MKDPKDWNRKDLETHLQHAIDLEFWTIPIYMTALYSIKGLKGVKPQNYPLAGKVVLSVLIQEMLHLELICNVSNALGYTPKFSAPGYDSEVGIPFICPPSSALPANLRGYSVKLRPLNVDSLKLFCVVEFPEDFDQASIHWSSMTKYASIAELYYALSIGIEHHWDKEFVGVDKNDRQKNNFSEYTSGPGENGFSQLVTSLSSAKMAIEAIVEQGEGATKGEIPETFQPVHFEPGRDYSPDMFEGNLCHYRKFYTLLHNADHLPAVYVGNDTSDSMAAQSELTALFTAFLGDLNESFATSGPNMTSEFWPRMMKLSEAVIHVWESGSCPKWS